MRYGGSGGEAAHRSFEVIERERLPEDTGNGCEAWVIVGEGAFTGHHEDRRLGGRCVASEGIDDAEAVTISEIEVEEDEVELAGAQQLNRLGGGLDTDDGMSNGSEHLADEPRDGALVFGEEYP